jgi:hypothetical protein
VFNVLDKIASPLIETSKIIILATALMVIVEFLELRFKDKIEEFVTKKPSSQYLVASLLGGIPGCVDAFFTVSLYTHGLVGFGALTAAMLSTAGDEALIMLLMAPDAALFIIVVCIILGVVGGFFADKIASAINLKTRQTCAIEVHKEDFNFAHFLKEHLYDHILKKHIPKMFMWIFFTLLTIDWLIAEFNFEPAILSMPRFTLIVLAALVGIIPESGSHLLFIMLYSRGMIPLSVLLVNTLSQDGHGLLPLLSHSIKDTIYVQVYTTLFSLAVGIVLFLAGF